VAFSSTADLGDLPTLMAHALLAGQGYEVVSTFFARAQLAAEALARGHADIGNGSTRTYWAAIGKGAGIATLMEQVGNGWSIVAVPAVRSCADLHGRRLAISGEGSVSGAIAVAYLRSRCPGVEPQVAIIAGSEHRAAALVSGRIDATALELADAVHLGFRAPGRFRTLVDFSTDLPGLKTTGVHVNREFLASRPRIVEDYLRALLVVHRRVRERPELLAEEARRRLRLDPGVLPEIVAAHLRTNAWDVNGGLTEAAVRDSLQFFVRAGSLRPGLTAGQVADLAPLERVLHEIGRR
jgi:NitT/TauT family transport system substrate-binding protein